ncbi:MAG: CSLREA domain-containing protein [Chloroflexi bacterium]|nr:CSLREA domain-containing protein [Chloroflexota bacterium]
MSNMLRFGMILLFVVGFSVSRPAHAATITVTTTTDELNADGDCSLREAIRAANSNTAVDSCPAGTSTDVINLSAGTYLLTISGRDEDAAASGDLDLLGDITLNGAGVAATIIDGNQLDRVFDILAGAQVQLAHLTIRNGYDMGSDAAIGSGGGLRSSGNATLTDLRVANNRAGGQVGEELSFQGRGGGILNHGTLTLVDSVLAENIAGGASPSIETFADGWGAGVFNTGTLVMRTTTVQGNHAGGGSDPGFGGGVYNTGTLTIDDSLILNNQAEPSVYSSAGKGGGIANEGGTITVSATRIAENKAYGAREGTGRGGGVANFSGTILIATSVISDNYVNGGYGGLGGFGGGIFNQDQISIDRSTITGNTAGAGYSMGTGGGIYNEHEAALTITNSTISQNQSAGAGTLQPGIGGGIGGGIATDGTLHLNNTTIHANHAGNSPNDPPGQGAGLFVGETGSATVGNSIIAGNINDDPQRPECYGTVESQGYNLIQSTLDCTLTGDLTGNLVGVDPLLGTLQNNGGPTQTHAPARNSPTLDAGNPATPGSSAQSCMSIDQRELSRPQDGNGDGVQRCDMGAVECVIVATQAGEQACAQSAPNHRQYLPLVSAAQPLPPDKALPSARR